MRFRVAEGRDWGLGNGKGGTREKVPRAGGRDKVVGDKCRVQQGLAPRGKGAVNQAAVQRMSYRYPPLFHH